MSVPIAEYDREGLVAKKWFPVAWEQSNSVSETGFRDLNRKPNAVVAKETI